MHVNPIIFIATVILVIVFVWMQKKKKAAMPKKPKFGVGVPPKPAAPRPVKPAKPPEEVFADLRKQAFATDPGAMGISVQENEAYGSLMELGMPSSIVTLICFANGDASFCYQSGGGMTGGGVHERVRQAAKQFILLSEKALPELAPATEQPLPQPDTVRFYVLTPKGIFTSEVYREDLADPHSPLGALFYAGQEVVTVMRQVQAQRAT
jgi:hypothetical protein